MIKLPLNEIRERLLSAKVNQIHDLVKISKIYSQTEIQKILLDLTRDWKSNDINLPTLYIQLKFFYTYLNSEKLQINFENQTAIPICHFSPFLRLGPSFLYSFLTVSSLKVKIFSLSENTNELQNYLEINYPSAIIFTLSQFHYIKELKKLTSSLIKYDLKTFVGGIPFQYDKNLKDNFPNCIFPEDVKDLPLLLKKHINGDIS